MLQHYKDKDQERLFLDIEANRNTDLESNGNWDGLLAEPPQEEYWAEERVSKRIRNRNHPTLRPEISYFYRRILEPLLASG